MKNLLFLLFFFPSYSLLAQDYENMAIRANNMFDNEEYSMSAILYDSLINQFPENALYYKKAGDSYFNTGETDKAIHRYRKAILEDKDYEEAYFKLASAYDKHGVLDSAIHYFKTYIDRNPQSVNAHNRLAITYMSKPGYEDSAISVSQRAINIDPENPQSYYVNGMAFLNDNHPVGAIFAARKGLRYDTSYALLYMPMGIGNLRRGNYAEAWGNLKKGHELSEDKSIFPEYLSLAEILNNTDKKTIETEEESERILFSKIHSDDLSKQLEEVKKEKSEYYYPALLRKFNDNPSSFSLDEFYMLYIGYTTDENYTPYFPENEELNELWEMERYNEYINEARLYLLEHPVSFHIYLKISMVAEYLGMAELQYENLFKYQGFLYSLMATGTGESEKDAIAVCYPWHEATIMSEMGYEIKDQKLLKVDEEVYELVTGENAAGEQKPVYFNITIPYRKLEKALEKQ